MKTFKVIITIRYQDHVRKRTGKAMRAKDWGQASREAGKILEYQIETDAELCGPPVTSTVYLRENPPKKKP